MKFVLYSTPKEVKYNNYLINNIENKIINNEALNEEEVNTILDYICYETRLKISNDLKNDTFENKDLLASSIIYNYFKELNVAIHTCNTRNILGEHIKNNNFLIVEILCDLYGQNYYIPYLIDPTYRQFFTKEKCNIDYQIIKHNTVIRKPDPGYYITSCDDEMISLLLSDGYSLFDPDLALVYGNSFLKTKTNCPISLNNGEKSFNLFDLFIKGSKCKLFQKDYLEKNNLIIKPNINLELKRCNVNLY